MMVRGTSSGAHHKRGVYKILILWLLLISSAGTQSSKLSGGFYDASCPSFKPVVANAIANRLTQDPSIAGPLLRLFFHDCFVLGCDASVLIKSTANHSAERDAGANATIRERASIDAIKAQLEALCPGVVSCADIVALAAKEAVFQSGGPNWEVEMGRRDGMSSTMEDASNNLPSSLSNAAFLIGVFASKGLSIRDLVTLSGAHSIGNGHCVQAARRIYGFNSPDGIDPTLDPTYAQLLRKKCPQPIVEHSRVPLDPLTPTLFDNKYYISILQKKGLFASDSSLVMDKRTASIVMEYATDQQSFFANFATSMVSMGRIGVFTDGEGEIRRHCSAFNKKSRDPNGALCKRKTAIGSFTDKCRS